jgi:hypothetical protein
MKKIITILAGGVILTILAITSCSNPTAGEETAAVTLYISGGPTNRAAYPDIPGNGAFHNSIKYQIYFEKDKPETHGNTPTAEKTGPGPHTVKVTPGTYRLFIVAILEDGVTYAEMDDSNSGVKYMDVDTRTTTTIPVAMHAKFPVFWEDKNWDTSLQSYIGSSKTSPVSVRMAVELSADNWTKIITAIVSGDLDNIPNKVIDLDLSYCTTPNHVFDPIPGTSAGKAKINKITLPLDATSIVDSTDDSAFNFNDFSKLTEVNAPSVTNVNNGIFRDCTALTAVSFPKAVNIGGMAFEGCTSLKNAILPKAVNISGMAFEGCASLKDVAFPEAVRIAMSAFYDCKALETVTFPEATFIGSAAFEGCDKLATVSFPNAVHIGGGAFRDCTSLTTVSFPIAETIDVNAFDACNKLTNVTLPKATEIGNCAFYDCKALKDVTLPEAVTIGISAFEGCNALETVTLSKATSISSAVFAGCTSLTSLKIFNAETIGNYAFSGTGDPTLSIYLGSTPPGLGTELFYGIVSSKTVNVFILGDPTGYGYGPLDTAHLLGSDNDGWLHGLAGSGWDPTTEDNIDPDLKNNNINASIAKNP